VQADGFGFWVAFQVAFILLSHVPLWIISRHILLVFATTSMISGWFSDRELTLLLHVQQWSGFSLLGKSWVSISREIRLFGHAHSLTSLVDLDSDAYGSAFARGQTSVPS
jgi:hypothetical protein